MIIICEPQCKGNMHESVNSGFIYGLRLAYPNEKLVLFAERMHIEAVKNIFINNNVVVDNIDYKFINFEIIDRKIYGFGGMFKYYILFKSIFNQLIIWKVDKIFFLSNNPLILYIIKLLKIKQKFECINCSFVLHGEFEEVSVNFLERSDVIKDRGKKNLVYYKSIFLKIIHNFNKIIYYIFRKIFKVKRIMIWRHSNKYNYIALSPHIVENAKEYLDTAYLNFKVIIMPIIFSNLSSEMKNKFVKFAVFGSGDALQMNKLLLLLKEKKNVNPYEIRIISTNRKGTEGFSNITYVKYDNILTRKEMEVAADDIDIFINLYDKDKHKLGCSLSIFEAMSYLKPVLHLDNDGYNYFNKIEKPIGFRCNSMSQLVEKMCDIIENYVSYEKDFKKIRNNIIDLRKEYDVKNNLENLRNSFTFNL